MVTVYYKRITMILLCSERIAKFPIQNTRNAIQLPVHAKCEEIHASNSAFLLV